MEVVCAIFIFPMVLGNLARCVSWSEVLETHIPDDD